MIKMRVLFVSCLIILNINLFGQEFYFKNIGTAQGLPSSETYHSLQDSKGYIWITSDAGICKYEGNAITTYTTKDGLPENVVFNVYEDVHGRIWFNSISGNLFYYEKGKFKTISANPQLIKMATAGITSFYIGERDTIYISIPHVLGIIKISPQGNYKNVIIQNPQQTETYYTIINKLNKNEILIGAMGVYFYKHQKSHGYYVYNFNNNKLYAISNELASANISKGSIDNENNIYLPSKSELNIINVKKNRIENYKFPSEILFIKQDKNGDCWIGTTNGGYFYRKSDLKLKPIHFLKELSVSDIMIDRENNIWVCSLQKGVLKSVNKDLFNIFSENDNLCNFSQSNEKLYVGFASKKIIEIDKNDSISYSTLKADNIPQSASLTYFLKTNLYSYYELNTDLFFVQNQKSNEIRNSLIAENPNIPVRKITQLGKDSFAIACYIDILFLNKQKILFSQTPPFIIKSMVQLKNKTLLIGSRNNEGIYQLKNNKFVPYFKDYPQLKVRINEMLEDSIGNLWIATNEKGLYCYSHNKLYEFNETKGLNSNKVNDFDIDKKGNVWIATNRGLNKISTNFGLKKAIVSAFNSSHGLPNLEVEHVTIFNNKVWCSAKEHLFYFDCDKMMTNTVSPFTFIKSVVINDSSVSISSNPVLRYDENNINFEFAAITYKNPEKKEFLYRLSGYEMAWELSTTGQCQYTNLPYGNYSFQVYALNNDKIKSALPATYNFTILKPFWLTFWFITIEIISLIAVVYFIFRWRVNKIKNDEEEKTRLNQKLAEFQMTAVRAQMNPHFVFNAISSIQHYILTNDKYNSYDYLAKFSRLIRNVLDNSQEEYISLEKEIVTLSLYIELEKIRFKVPFEFSLIVDKEIDLTDIDIPTMLIQPYIENAIWHGLMPKQNDCLLELEIKKVDSILQVTIRDNGVGRASAPKNNGHVSKGMGLMEQRLKALSVKNNDSFSVIIIDLKDENAKSCGTEVKISMPLLFD